MTSVTSSCPSLHLLLSLTLELCLTLNVMFLGSPPQCPLLLLYSCCPVAISSPMEISHISVFQISISRQHLLSEFHNCLTNWLLDCPKLPGGSMVKNPLANARCGFDPRVRKIPCRREWQSTSVFLPGNSLVVYSRWGCKKRWTRLSD